MRPDAVNELVSAASRRAGLAQAVRPHQLRHAFASNVLDAGGTLDEVQDLLGHANVLRLRCIRILTRLGCGQQSTLSPAPV